MMNRKPTSHINGKDLALISAYLDGQLSESQLRQVRHRIGEDENFRQAFQEMRMTRLALRSTPKIKRQRSFTLTPDMVAKPARGFGLRTASRMLATAATVLLVVVFAGGVLLRGGFGGMGASVAYENFTANSSMADDTGAAAFETGPSGGGGEPPMAQQAPEMDAAAGEASEAVAGAAEAAGAVQTTEEPFAATATAEIIIEMTNAPRGEGGDADTTQGFAPSTETPAPTQTQAYTPTVEPAPLAAAATGEEPWFGETTAEDQITTMKASQETASTSVTGEPETGISLLTITELALLALALVGWAAVLITRRRQ